MTQVIEKVAIANANDDKAKTEKCEWKDCKSNHSTKLKYPKGGDVARNTSYKGNWIAAGLEPWVLNGPGKDSQFNLKVYRKETPAAKYAKTAAELTYPEYHTQKHHLLSVNFFNAVKKLAHNAKLVGYDVNHKNNGICLPSYVVDIVQHDLQCHRGSHPKALYNDKVKALLKNLEKKCIKYCHLETDGVDSQLELLASLNRQSVHVAGKIKAWKWLLRSNALVERVQSEARLSTLSR